MDMIVSKGIHRNLWYGVLGKHKNLVLIGLSALPFHPQGFPDSQLIENLCNAGDQGSVPGLGRSSGEGKVYPLQYAGLENSMDCIVHGVTKSWTQLSDSHFHPQPLVFVFQNTKITNYCVFRQFQRKLRVKEEQEEYNLFIPEDSANNKFYEKIMCVLYKCIFLQ